MGDDVEAPLLEVTRFVLRFADDHLDDRAFHPLRLPAEPLQNLAQTLPVIPIRRSGQLRLLPGYESLDLGELGLPAGPMRWSIRAQVTLSMQTSMDLPVFHRVEQCSTKSSASLSRRSSAVMTS